MGEDDQGYHNIVTGNLLLNSPNDTYLEVIYLEHTVLRNIYNE